MTNPPDLRTSNAVPPDAALVRRWRDDSAVQDTRSKTTLRARRLGTAVRLARIHESLARLGSAFVHQSRLRRARSGSVKPRRSSISENVRTTVSAYRLS